MALSRTPQVGHPAIRPFVHPWAALLTTYRRDGRPVGTPVNIVVLGGRVVFRTYAQSWKFRRLERDQRVLLAPSSIRGKPTGEAIPGLARLLDGPDDDEAGRAIDAKYPVFQRLLVRLGHRLLRYRTVHFEIRPDRSRA